MTSETPTTPFFPLSYPPAFSLSHYHKHCPESNITNLASPFLLKKFCCFDSSLSGKGTKIAFVCAFGSPTLLQDLDFFCKAFSLSNCELKIHYPFGKPKKFTSSWSLEASLCSQWIHSLCENAEIFAVISPTDSIYDLINCCVYASKELSCDIVTMSFGCEEFKGQKELSSAIKRCCDKTVFVAAAGNSSGKVYFPGTCENVICTCASFARVNMKTFHKVGQEYAAPFCSGGVSLYEKAPNHQCAFFNLPKNKPNMRLSPDFCIRLPSNIPICSYSSNAGWFKVNGTSLCCALAGCLCSHVLEKRPASLSSKSSLARYFYTLAGGTGYDTKQRYFYDVTLGTNSKHFAKVGWDFCTGLGSANAAVITKG